MSPSSQREDPRLPAPGDADVTQTRLPASPSPAVLGRPRRNSSGSLGVHHPPLPGRRSLWQGLPACDPSLKRQVALKVAKPEQMHSPGRIERFQREARAAAPLTHNHIVAVYDHGQDGPHHYLATAFVPGLSLERCLRSCLRARPCRSPKRCRSSASWPRLWPTPTAEGDPPGRQAGQRAASGRRAVADGLWPGSSRRGREDADSGRPWALRSSWPRSSGREGPARQRPVQPGLSVLRVVDRPLALLGRFSRSLPVPAPHEPAPSPRKFNPRCRATWRPFA